MKGWLDLATISRTVGIKGDLLLSGATDLFAYIEDGMNLFIVPPPEDIPRSLRISCISIEHNGDAKVRFDGIDSIDVASEYVGKHCLVRFEGGIAIDARALEGDIDLMGYTAIDTKGDVVGNVVDVIESVGQTLLVIELKVDSSSSPGSIERDHDHDHDHEVMVPFVDEIVQDVDEKDRRVVLNMPKGLIEAQL